MLRAMRLVVDTGIHSKGWTREQAIKYMLDNSGLGETEVKSEVERYIAIPSQALAYKIGALTIQRLRKKAEAELGPKFDIREFHAQVLMTGALPLAMLEQQDRQLDRGAEGRLSPPRRQLQGRHMKHLQLLIGLVRARLRRALRLPRRRRRRRPRRPQGGDAVAGAGRSVHGQRRSEFEAQPDQRAVPRRSALRRSSRQFPVR